MASLISAHIVVFLFIPLYPNLSANISQELEILKEKQGQGFSRIVEMEARERGMVRQGLPAKARGLAVGWHYIRLCKSRLD